MKEELRFYGNIKTEVRKMFENILSAIKDRDMLCVYIDDKNTESFCFGRLDYADDRFFLINEISPKGLEEGIVLRKIDSIFKIEKDSQYCNDMKLLMKANDTEFKKYDFKNEKLVYEVLKYALDNKLVVTLFCGDEESKVTGFPLEIDNDFCKLTVVDDYGYEYEQQFIVYLNEVWGIDCDNEKEKRLKLLHELNK